MFPKAELRRDLLARRRQLPEAEWQRRSELLKQGLFQHFAPAQWQWLHLFLPLQRQREPDTWPIIQRLWAEALPVRLAVPVVQADGRLLHYHLRPDTELRENRWGIPEPVGAEEVKPPVLDAVLVPLLAFDEQGHRVGYGKGFYDRFLRECPQALRIGLSLEPPVPRITDVGPDDVPLHACLTPERVWWF